jgi:dihydrofolate synthase / folylpolyglutamate synthase
VTAPAAAGARAYLSSLETFGIKLGLSTMQRICAGLDHPEQAWTAVHVGGTNGKGSVAAMVDEALRAAGHRVGCYTSPHLVRLEERFRIGGTPVGSGALDEAVLRVRSVVTTLQEQRILPVHPTFFEVTTAAAFELFRSAAVDVAVLEVGLGGRYDATNVVTPRAAAITSVALDHEEQLGPTVEAVAFEKAGIVKAGRPVVLGRLGEGPRAVVTSVAAERGAPVVHAADGCRVAVRRDRGLTVIDLVTPVRHYGSITLSLRGTHQVENAIVAARLLEVLDDTGLRVPAEAIRAGLERVRWPARLELLDWRDGRRVLLDGAHNPAGAAALADYIAAEWPAGLPLVFGAMRDKQLAAMLDALRAVARPLVLTEAPGRRAAPLSQLHEAARAAGIEDVVSVADVSGAMAHAWTAGDPIAVAGSLYLAGRVLELGGRT